jgi:hypothetical protein
MMLHRCTMSCEPAAAVAVITMNVQRIRRMGPAPAAGNRSGLQQPAVKKGGCLTSTGTCCLVQKRHALAKVQLPLAAGH